jgi:hypothetical protein
MLITNIDIWHTPGDSYCTCYMDVDNERLTTYLTDTGSVFEKGIVTFDPRAMTVAIQDYKTYAMDTPNSRKLGWIATWNKSNPEGNYKPYTGNYSGYYAGAYTTHSYDQELDPWFDSD